MADTSTAQWAPLQVGRCHVQTGDERFGPGTRAVARDRASQDELVHPSLAERARVVPLLQLFRNNLTALSQLYNLYFAVYGAVVYIYRPLSNLQRLTSQPDGKIHLPRCVVSGPHNRGYIYPPCPRYVNHILVGFFGMEEILVTAADNGDVVAFYTKPLAERVHRGLAGEEVPFSARFLVENVYSSAWGLAIHSMSRLIAVSSNLHRVTVFAPALINGSLQPYMAATTMGHLTQKRDRNWRILVTLPDAAGNIPNISFVNDHFGNARKICCVDISGDVWIADLWDPGPVLLFSSRIALSMGWGILVLHDMDFGIDAQSQSAIEPLPTSQTPVTRVAMVPDMPRHVFGQTPIQASPNMEPADVQVLDLEEVTAASATPTTTTMPTTTTATIATEGFDPDSSLVVDLLPPRPHSPHPTISEALGPDAEQLHITNVSKIGAPTPTDNSLLAPHRFEIDALPAGDDPVRRDGNDTSAEGETIFWHAIEAKHWKAVAWHHLYGILPTSVGLIYTPHLGMAHIQCARGGHSPFAAASNLSSIQVYPTYAPVKRTSPVWIREHGQMGQTCILVTGSTDIHMHNLTTGCSSRLDDPALCQRPSSAVITPYPFRHCRRLNMIAHVPPLNLVVIGSMYGRVILLTPLRRAEPAPNQKYYHYIRVDAVLPSESDERANRRPNQPLFGIAVGPVQRPPPSGSFKLGGKMADQPTYRLMLHYRDFTILSYELRRGLRGGLDISTRDRSGELRSRNGDRGFVGIYSCEGAEYGVG